MATKYVICLVLMAAAIVMLIIGDRQARVDGSEWRVRPSDSGKTWILYRWVGLGQERSNKRFKTREAAENYARASFLQTNQPTAERPHGPPDAVAFVAKGIEGDIARAKLLANEHWAKANNSLEHASAAREFSMKTSHLRIAKQSLDQVKRHSRVVQLSTAIDVEEFERRLRSAAALLLAHEEPSSQISQVKESPTGAVPAEVKVAVWSRDGGACVHCGSNKQLRFAPTFERACSSDYDAADIQLACEPCCKSKSRKRRL